MLYAMQYIHKSMVREMCRIQLKVIKTSPDLMLLLDLKETIDQLTIANSVYWYGHVMRREDWHVLRRALHFEVEGQSMNGRLSRTRKRQVEEENVKIGLRRKDALCRSMWIADVNQIAVGLR